MEKLHVLLTPNNNGRCGRCEPCVKKDLLGLWFYKYYHEKPLTLLLRRSALLISCKFCGEVPYVWKTKNEFRYRFNNFKSKHRAFRKGNQKFPKIVFARSLLSRWPHWWWMGLMNGILWFLKNVKHMSSWKKEKTFGNTDVKSFMR